MHTNKILFSIIVPTRNRPALLQRALESVVGQSYTDYEVIIVDDGSDAESLAENKIIAKTFGHRFSLIERSIWEPRHGPNDSRNDGFRHTKGQYIGFLDDDDYWCDRQHLEVSKNAVLESKCDLYLCDQIAKRNDDVIVSEWLPFLNRVVTSRQKLASVDCYFISMSDCLQPEGIGFPHVNTSFVRRELFERVNGFWNGSPYEGDLNFFLRLLDVTATIVYHPKVVAVNVLREKESVDGVSSIAEEAKMLYRVLVCEHVRLSVGDEVGKYAKLLQSGVFKSIAKKRHRLKDYNVAADFAMQALSLNFSIKWVAISIYLKSRGFFSNAW